MDYFGLIRAILSVLSFVVMIVVAVAGYIAFKKITSNHLFHIDESLKEVKKEVKENAENIVDIKTDIAVIATKLECTLE